jgi:hypothetical protein
MKKEKYIITMENPCSKDWNSMTPSEKGMFCGKCSKHVVDLAFASDDEILKQVSVNDKFCGRFSPEQLNRPLLPAKKTNHNSFFSKIASGLFFIASSGNIASGQTTKKEPVVLEEIKTKNKKIIEEWAVPDAALANGTVPAGALVGEDSLKNTIQGIICNMDNTPADSATITLDNTSWKTLTDNNGYFKITLPDSLLLNDTITFEISGNSYGGKLTLQKQQYNLIEQHRVAYRARMLGGVRAFVQKGVIVNDPLPFWYQSIFDFLR